MIDQEKAHTLGINALVMNPILRQDMAAMIRKVLDRKE
jgi:hypothetical protein